MDNKRSLEEREVAALEKIARLLDELVREVAGGLEYLADAVEAQDKR